MATKTGGKAVEEEALMEAAEVPTRQTQSRLQLMSDFAM